MNKRRQACGEAREGADMSAAGQDEAPPDTRDEDVARADGGQAGAEAAVEARVAEARAAFDELRALLRLNIANIEPTSPGPAEILPHLLLGSCADARNLEVLSRLRVTHVLNCAGASVRTGEAFYASLGMQYQEFQAEDSQGQNIMQHYETLASAADAALEAGGRLFVHCEAGVNRSGCLCIAYHLVHSGAPLLESARHCKGRRGRICTNEAFQRQLFAFALERRLPLR
ncbi:unnamed protein product [Prorocentrum cordatum]|uniref:protein-tyrosine-phosphatase n=1 Tax=Prorocentrum cordatum TaxID=2364126 RepID=A0ABN9Y525_9DINO|nr:unnamed protein product [Polarella glacialis]